MRYSNGKSVECKPPKALTKRNLEVLKFASFGKTNREIADILGIAAYTVASHLAVCQAVLNACNRTSAVAMAIRQGLI
jgi:DNA-binding CsgD family transcriptional regulator